VRCEKECRYAAGPYGRCVAHACRLTVAGFQHGFADGDSKTGGEVYFGAILNNPTGLLKQEINLLTGPFFGCHGRGACDCMGILSKKLTEYFLKILERFFG
jgi:hypothetical protein